MRSVQKKQAATDILTFCRCSNINAHAQISGRKEVSDSIGNGKPGLLSKCTMRKHSTCDGRLYVGCTDITLLMSPGEENFTRFKKNFCTATGTAI